MKKIKATILGNYVMISKKGFMQLLKEAGAEIIKPKIIKKK